MEANVRRRKIIQIAVNQTQLFALCDDGSLYVLASGEKGFLPMDTRIVETGTPVFRDAS